MLVGPVGARKLPVDVDHHAGLGRPGTRRVGRKDALTGGDDRLCLGFREEPQWYLHFALLRVYDLRNAGEAVNEKAADTVGGELDEFPALHASGPGRLR